MICCKNDLGETAHNKDFDTGIEVIQNGLHALDFKAPSYARFTKYYSFIAGENIIIPAGVLNEDFVYNFTIQQPDGTTLEVNECPNFSVKTFVNKVDCVDIEYL